MSYVWDLILCTVPLPGSTNMAFDQLLKERAARIGRPSLRFYTWFPPALSLGHSQSSEGVVRWDYCSQHGIDVVRRPTGGRAVLHHRELTYSVAGTLGEGPFPLKLQETYQVISELLVRGLNDLGIPAKLWSSEAVKPISPRTPVPCFSLPSPGEIAVEDRKIIGSAMNVNGRVFLQHGSILMSFDEALQRGVTRFPVTANVATTEEFLPNLTTAQLSECMISVFERELHVRFKNDENLEKLIREAALRSDSFRVPGPKCETVKPDPSAG